MLDLLTCEFIPSYEKNIFLLLSRVNLGVEWLKTDEWQIKNVALYCVLGCISHDWARSGLSSFSSLTCFWCNHDSMIQKCLSWLKLLLNPSRGLFNQSYIPHVYAITPPSEDRRLWGGSWFCCVEHCTLRSVQV